MYILYMYIYMYIMYIYIYILTCNSKKVPHLLKCKMCDEARYRFNNYESKPRCCQDSKPKNTPETFSRSLLLG